MPLALEAKVLAAAKGLGTYNSGIGKVSCAHRLALGCIMQ